LPLAADGPPTSFYDTSKTHGSLVSTRSHKELRLSRSASFSSVCSIFRGPGSCRVCWSVHFDWWVSLCHGPDSERAEIKLEPKTADLDDRHTSDQASRPVMGRGHPVRRVLFAFIFWLLGVGCTVGFLSLWGDGYEYRFVLDRAVSASVAVQSVHLINDEGWQMVPGINGDRQLIYLRRPRLHLPLH
jgi:hypothetical protein